MENGRYQNAFILDAGFIRQNIAEADGVIYVGGKRQRLCAVDCDACQPRTPVP